MVLDEERISMKIQAMGRAVMELSLADFTYDPAKHHRQAEAVPEGNRKRDRQGCEQGCS